MESLPLPNGKQPVRNIYCRGMDKNLETEFSSLSEDSRVDTLLRLAKLCSFQQQLQFIETLSEQIHKDIIGFLPDNVVEKVFSFLSVEDAVNCNLVSRKWNKVVESCSLFWNMKTEELGLSKTFIAEQIESSKFKCLKDLCVAAISQHKRIHNLIIHRASVFKNASGVSSNFVYAGQGVTLRYSELNGNAQVVIESVISPHSLVEIVALSVEPFGGQIKWSSSSEDYVLWKQLDGKWNGYDITNLGSELEQWVDEPITQGFHTISFCWCCHLVAIVSEAEGDLEVWDLQVIKLDKGKTTVRKMVYPLPLERVQSMWQKKRYFIGGDVTLLSDSIEKDDTGFCQSHRIFLQVDSKLVVYQLKSVPMSERLLLIHDLLPDALLSKPLHVFSPEVSEQPFLLTDLQASKEHPHFCFSFDYSQVALLHESYLYIWTVNGSGDEGHVDLLFCNLPRDCKCVAVGSLYAVLASNSLGMCYVVQCRTGELVLQVTAAEHNFNHEAHHTACFNFFAPINQQWLSDFKVFNFWPVATVLDNSNRHNELKVLVGTRNQSMWQARGN